MITKPIKQIFKDLLFLKEILQSEYRHILLLKAIVLTGLPTFYRFLSETIPELPKLSNIEWLLTTALLFSVSILWLPLRKIRTANESKIKTGLTSARIDSTSSSDGWFNESFAIMIKNISDTTLTEPEVAICNISFKDKETKNTEIFNSEPIIIPTKKHIIPNKSECFNTGIEFELNIYDGRIRITKDNQKYITDGLLMLIEYGSIETPSKRRAHSITSKEYEGLYQLQFDRPSQINRN